MKRPLALVTGGNRGLGRETCRQLAQRGIDVILTARSQDEAADAARALNGEGASVTPLSLDVTDADSVAELVAQLGDRQLDVLVNNAGVALKGFDADVVRQTMAVNVDGVMRVTAALLPRLAQDARIVNVSSGMGELTTLGPNLRSRFADPALTEDDLRSLLGRFHAEVRSGTHRGSGWPSSAYNVSKVALNAYTRMLARQLEGGRRVNAVCPGWVRTDMGGSRAPRSVEDGARGIVWAATLPPDGPTGGFFRDGEAIPW